MSAAMFDPLPNGANAAPRTPEWRVIMPAPENAPAPPATHPKLGRASIRWEYRDSAGRLNGCVCRFDMPDGDKEIRSLVFAEHKRWGRQWRWLGFPKPRPLYGLDRLAARPEAPVIIAEGEKAADAAALLLPDYVVITSPAAARPPVRQTGRRWPGARSRSGPTRTNPARPMRATFARSWRNCRWRPPLRSSNRRPASPRVGMPPTRLRNDGPRCRRPN